MRTIGAQVGEDDGLALRSRLAPLLLGGALAGGLGAAAATAAGGGVRPLLRRGIQRLGRWKESRSKIPIKPKVNSDQVIGSFR